MIASSHINVLQVFLCTSTQENLNIHSLKLFYIKSFFSENRGRTLLFYWLPGT